MDKSKRSTYIIAAAALVVIIVAVYFLFIANKKPTAIKSQEASQDVIKNVSDINLKNRPFITLTPTADGAEIIISIENMTAFDRIEYELTYQANNPQVAGEKLERGATGTDINTKDAKYKKSILLGTASKGVRSPDTGITDGKLAMHMFKGQTEYDSETEWNIYRTSQVNTIKSADGNFAITSGPLAKDYWMILANTLGVPANRQGIDLNKVALPVYGTFSIAGDFTSPGSLSIKLAKDSKDVQLNSYSLQSDKWQKMDSTYDSASKTVTAKPAGFGVFVITASQ